MKLLADFLPEVMPSVNGCPYPIVINAVRNSAIEFLTKSGLREQTLTIQMLPGQSAYPIVPSVGTSLPSFVRGQSAGGEVLASSPVSLEQSATNWRDQTANYPAHAFIENGLLTVSPTPQVASSLSATFIETVARTANDVCDDLFEDWLEEIASGALFRLLAMPGLGWSNAPLADYHKANFVTAIDEAKIFKLKGGTNDSIRVTPRAFGG